MWSDKGSKSVTLTPARPNKYQEDEDERSNVSIKYLETFQQSIEEPDKFWGKISEKMDWSTPWTKVIDNTDEPFTKWFIGGELNACYNAVDRHVKAGKGNKVALIHDSPLTNTIRKVTYNELLEKVSRLSGALASYGVKVGDRVLIYMPLIPETIIAMLATVRLGAVHSVVFGGFAARELCTRIDHASPKVIIGASCGVEPNKIIRYKLLLNEAISLCTEKPKKCIIFQRKNVQECLLEPDMDVDWEEVLKYSEPHPCVPVESNHPMYILYTSGTTGHPKGVLRLTGGHLTMLTWTMKAIYNMTEDDVWWTASDMGWVLGHSYICYGPLCAGVTSVMYEGKPDRTPHPGQYFRVVQEHKVNAVFTAPTALRVIKRADPLSNFGKKYSTKSLKYIFVAGEHCDQETKLWAENAFKAPILNHWWQTETGSSITCTAIGLGNSLNVPKYTVGLPFPGYDVRIVRKDGTECAPDELGQIVIKLPLAPGAFSTLYKDTQRFLDIYFRSYPGFYDTKDVGYRDVNGYFYITARDDDVINVAGHRLSTSALEDVVLSHPDVADTAVIGVPESTKGDVPLCLYVLKNGSIKNEEEINQELVKLVRELIGPIAALRICVCVSALPRTRSGKIPRKSIADLARNKPVTISAAIEDPTVYKEIKKALQKVGYATTAPDLLIS
ncbi:acyl-CoA synthetase short-chain family member 3, mitochondrial [Cimex lectularius]|uniref:Acyl-CoA synthetase short-chain family member 3, mitochondrial n=1 Tax=Cimex lectularius TaxID=79782 RepID=A0A8I6S8B8_CIMLE|nr:acyl-CoA synthetase short-chain family member 3, mitochondrial [Cimex lectularius]